MPLSFENVSTKDNIYIMNRSKYLLTWSSSNYYRSGYRNKLFFSFFFFLFWVSQDHCIAAAVTREYFKQHKNIRNRLLLQVKYGWSQYQIQTDQLGRKCTCFIMPILPSSVALSMNRTELTRSECEVNRQFAWEWEGDPSPAGS